MSHVAKALGVLIGVIAASGLANAQDMRKMSILTGPEGGTYHRFGKDIAEVVRRECGADIEVRTSQGSLDNLARLRNEPYTQMAIVQQDVLDYVRLSQNRDPTLKEWIEKFKYVLPLYREEVHIVARRAAGLRTIADLRGKSVAVGEVRSGTLLTATLIRFQALEKTGMRSPAIDIGPREGILRLLGLEPGERVDAVFYVAGQPVPLLSGLDDRITERHLAQLSLVAVPSTSVSKRYSPAEFSKSTYRWLDRAVETVAVRAVLIAYDFKGQQCDNVAMTARLIKENLEELRERIGHEKWRDVGLDAEVPGWQPYGCVATRLSTPFDGCRFVKDEEKRPPADTPRASIDCSQVCSARERKQNALACMVCQDRLGLEK
jgi:uncharacterized protein